jgi:hypothetical protein
MRFIALTLANAPAERYGLVKSLSLDLSDNRVVFAFKLLIAKVLRFPSPPLSQRRT